MRGLGSLANLPQLPSVHGPTQKPQGSHATHIKTLDTSDWYTAPPGFITGQNSITEWTAYKALAKIFNNPHDPHIPPFFGGYPDWAYQVAEIGGHTRAIGSAVVDFVVYQGSTVIGIRIQTEHYHLFTDSAKQVYDDLQRATLEHQGITVVDVYDNDLLNDPTGQRAVIAMKHAIGRIERINPDIAATAIRASRQRPYR